MEYDEVVMGQRSTRGFRQFDAPVSVVVTFDRELLGGDIARFDCGAHVNALVNAAWSRGLGCVVNSQGIMPSPVVREHAGIPGDEVIMNCVAMGWPDETFPANAVVSKRRPVERWRASWASRTPERGPQGPGASTGSAEAPGPMCASRNASTSSQYSRRLPS
jgi:hypothetical protein